MKALKPIYIIFAIAVTSCYFFPFVLDALPMANSKMILAVIGLVLLGISLIKKGNAIIDHDFLSLSLWALAISLIAFISITINNTPDDTFVTYFMSMWVWLGGAYAVISLIKSIHGGVSVPLVVNYLLAVCVLQCIIALVFDNVPAASDWHKYTFGGEGFMGNNESRMHGIGCSLDVAGFRFACVMVMTAFLLCNYTPFHKNSKWISILYIIAICFISVIGNMMSRSTIVGTTIALLYIIVIGIIRNKNFKLFSQLTILLAAIVCLCVFLYNTNAGFRSNIQFGFEGFFSLVERGEWQTNSNDILKNMIVWPEDTKTWIIGDGYFNNPADKSLTTFDLYYTGENFGGFYMATDIGYLRYIFYFGTVGLLAFSLFFIKVCRICVIRFEYFKWMFIMMLALNFIEWFKVSTDLFVVFAPFICISTKENQDYINRQQTEVLKS